MTTRGITATSAVEFLRICGQLKRLKRTGWVNHKVNGPESVADHMYRMAMCTLLLDGDSSVDKTRCIKMAIVHDLAESYVGDITPHDGVSNAEKHRLELNAINEICHKLGHSQAALEIKELWHEYEDAATDEAKLVKDIDKFEMILQADEYETAQDNLHLDQFFTSTDGKFQTPLVQSWVQELSAQRRTRRTGASTHAST
ncbi:hypothetical protein H310_08318 [Aphanomyces invadans]|uniref:5'-deoxynucleotidase n=1 Tax=Aphanomyces invadans TaxID=157072 RepID=A0A024TXR2_9STRA|nr:hypothetical protein H310_08318 [Aphanomyces invadans]ETV98813.1 hypothetical protein H310_08318 [Aphanomyces invadans]|eukprot:XP_008872241.1 hypothetical protein H310_08318 [Aphanomyces invadans]